jgi:hypothetical protein
VYLFLRLALAGVVESPYDDSYARALNNRSEHCALATQLGLTATVGPDSASLAVSMA